MNKSYSSLATLALIFSMAAVQGQEIPGKENFVNPLITSPDAIKSKALVYYVANEGFLIQTSNHKILIDALFGGFEGDWCEQPGDSLLKLIIDGQPPFGNIDIALVSHYHLDHFNEKLVSEFMVKNTRTIMFGPEQVIQLLMKNQSYPQFSERIRPIHYSDNRDASIVEGDIRIMAMTMSHGEYLEKDALTGELKNRHKDVENISYLVKADSCTFLHSGDASVKAFENYKEFIPQPEKVDLAMMNRVFMQPEGLKVINELIKPEKLIFMHIEPSMVEYYRNIVKDFSEILILRKPLESVFY